MKIKKSTNQNADIGHDLITVNNFFAHLVKEINIAKYGIDKELIPTFSPYKTYQHAGAMLKRLPKDGLKAIEKTQLDSKQVVCYAATSIDRGIHDP